MTDTEHIFALLREHHISAAWTAAPYGEVANPVLRKVRLSPAEDDAAYFGALHEIGHVVLGHIDPPWHTSPPRQLATEAEATLWALEHAGRELSEGLRREAAGNQGSYFDGLGHWPDAPGADTVRDVLGLIGSVELPWPRVNAAFQRGRAAYLGLAPVRAGLDFDSPREELLDLLIG